MHNYQRVLPRDLFNEAKLLKCLGALTLHIHDGILPELEFEHDGQPFDIVLSDSGELSVSNLFFKVSRTNNDHSIWFYTNYNSKESYPLCYNFDDETGYVFTDSGAFADEFQALLKPEHVCDEFCNTKSCPLLFYNPSSLV